MTDTFYRGIPINRAILVRHTPLDERNPTQQNNEGAIALAPNDLTAAFNYICRDEKWEEKGDMDRSLTLDDQRLHETFSFERKPSVSKALDYAARLNEFEHKGEDRQVDATLWGQHGPYDRASVEKEMLRDGGAYIDSIVTIKREYATRLGIETKQDFQRLIRKTWTDNAMEWTSRITHQRMFNSREEVRWVAAYHTDANESLHVHIYTWSAEGRIQPTDTILPIGTRLGKEIILKEGYSEIRQERNQEGEFLRNLMLNELKIQAGFNVAEAEIAKLEAKQKRYGFDDALEKNIDILPENRVHLEKDIEILRNALEKGEGIVARNQDVQNAAKNVIKDLHEFSPSIQRLAEKNAQMFETKAVLKGFTLEKRLQELKNYLKSEEQDLFKREINKIIRELLPKRETKIELREDLQRLNCRQREGWENVSFSTKLTDYDVNFKISDYIFVKELTSSVHEPKFIAISKTDVGNINDNKAYLSQIKLDGQYERFNKNMESIGWISGKQIVNTLGKADMNKICRLNLKQTNEEARRQEDKLKFKKQLQENRERITTRAFNSIPKSEKEVMSDFSIKHGLSLEQTRQLQYNVARLTKSMQFDSENIKDSSSLVGLNKNEKRIDHLTKEATTTILKSKEMDETRFKIVQYLTKNNPEVSRVRIEKIVNKNLKDLANEQVKKSTFDLSANEQSKYYELKEKMLQAQRPHSISHELNQDTKTLADLIAKIADCGSNNGARGRKNALKWKTPSTSMSMSR